MEIKDRVIIFFIFIFLDQIMGKENHGDLENHHDFNISDN